ncbi:MAG: hypothetical protein CML01_11470 [Pseudomonas sp.]|nr:hypothetical protein [Pseudomonas sp.]|tara:strand:- start:50265 stop:50450 length:186 start_codon:yes stop_codon:yes gene_type:complete
MIRSASVASAVFIGIFLLVAFSRWEINPGEWSEATRAGVAVIGSIFAFFAAAIDKELNPYG